MRLFMLVGWALCEGLQNVCEKLLDIVEIFKGINFEKLLLRLKNEVIKCLKEEKWL